MSPISNISLRNQLRRAERRTQFKAVLLILPLFLFIIVAFVLPIGAVLTRAIYDPLIQQALPKTMESLKEWNGIGIPDEASFAALANDIKAADRNEQIALLGKNLNYEISGIRSKIQSAARKIREIEDGPWKPILQSIDPVFGSEQLWSVISRHRDAITWQYLLNAVDLRYDESGKIAAVPSDRAIYKDLYLRTFSISLTVTILTLILAYPVAWLLANVPARIGNILLICVLLPFWTSLLVRTTAWFVLLQDNGLINDILVSLYLTDEPFKLIFSRFGTVIAMTHIQLPFTLLPIYSVMKTISPTYMRAATSLGAHPVIAFIKIYVPLTLPGVAAGCLLTFILSLGFYITPALVGGPGDQMVSGIIANAMNRDLNWGKASALGAILLFATIILYFVYDRIVGIDKMKLG